MSKDVNPFVAAEYAPPEVDWSDLSPQEQTAFVRMGYTPPPDTVMSNAAYTELEQRNVLFKH